MYTPSVARTALLSISLFLVAACDLTPPARVPEPQRPAVTCDCPDDGIPCTAELCDEGGECVHRPDDRACEASGACRVAICAPEAGGCTFASRPTGTPCDEGAPVGGGGPPRGCIQSECLPGHVVGLERLRVLRLTGVQPMSDDGFVMNLARVDDRTGDGVDELAVTSFRLVAFAPDALPGRIVLFDPVAATPIWDAAGSPENLNFGYRLQPISDVTGDGLSDLVATERVGGVPGVDAIDGSTGAIVWRFEEPQALYTRFAVAGDQNADGVEDLYVAVGQALAKVSGADGSVLDAVADAFGPDIASVTDVDGDGLRDVLVDSEPAVYRSVRLVSSADLSDLLLFDFPKEHVWVSGRNDVDGDGVDEGLLTHSDGVVRAREAYDLVTGESRWTQRYPRSAPLTIYDIDGDGIDDLITDGSHLGSGWRTIVAQSGADGTTAFEFVPVDDHGAIAPIDTGFTQIGDLNDDGVDDLAVGDELAGARVWIYTSVVRWF